MFCALFVLHFNYYVGVLRTISFLPSLLRWCFAHYLFSTLTTTLLFWALFVLYFHYNGVLRTICFLLLLLRWCFVHYLFSTFTITLVFCALSVFYFNYFVGVLRTIYFLLLLLRRRVGTICFPLLRLGWCFAHYLFSTFTMTLVFCALFVFYFY